MRKSPHIFCFERSRFWVVSHERSYCYCTHWNSDRQLDVTPTPQTPQVGECRSGLLYTRRHLIWCTIGKCDVTTQVTESICFTHFFPWKNKFRPRINSVLQLHSTVRIFKAHPTYPYTVVQTVGKTRSILGSSHISTALSAQFEVRRFPVRANVIATTLIWDWHDFYNTLNGKFATNKWERASATSRGELGKHGLDLDCLDTWGKWNEPSNTRPIGFVGRYGSVGNKHWPDYRKKNSSSRRKYESW